MAYDPNDAADVAIVEGLVSEATSRLKLKNEELIGELRKAREGKVDPALVERLERQLEKVQTDLEAATKAKNTAENNLKKANETVETVTKKANDLTASTALTKAMAEHKIADPFHDAVVAMFGAKAVVKTENGVESVLIGDKTVSDALKDFAASDVGKHYVAAPANGGGGSNGGGANGAAKSLTRVAFDALDVGARMAFVKDGGTLTDS